MGQILISAAHKSSGKTLVATGICAALHAQSKVVQPFKKGPDYIDPMWLSTAAQRNCYNLDFWTQSHDEITQLFSDKSANSDIAIIEANKGLYDGLDLEGSNSNAALAKLLGSPVILVLDCRGTIRGIAPLLLGYQQFDSAVNIQGVILNFVGGSRHEHKLRQVIEHYTDLKLLGAIQRDESLILEERYLGLMPSNEDQQALSKVQVLGNAISNQVDLEALLKVAASIPSHQQSKNSISCNYQLTIGYAKDEAFGFYYADDLETFTRFGATLVPFNTCTDKQLPNVDALFFGGGFPEKKIKELEANKELRTCIFNALNDGLPAYAECGGLMYLANSIQYDDRSGAMVGFIDADCFMTPKPQGRGYTQFKENENSLWSRNTTTPINAHEFHYSYLEGLNEHSMLTFDVHRGKGIIDNQDGLRIKNTLACYAHQRHTQNNQWISKYLDFVQTYKSSTA